MPTFLYAYFEEGGQLYLVQEWIEGQPLSKLVKEDWSEAQARSLTGPSTTAEAPPTAKSAIPKKVSPIMKNFARLRPVLLNRSC